MSKYLIQFGDANRAPSKSIAPVLAETDRVRTQEDYEALVRFAYRKRANGGLEFWTVKKEHKDVSFFRIWPVPEDWESDVPNTGATIDQNPFGGYTDEEFDAARAAADKAREERKAEKAAAEAAKPVPAPVAAKVAHTPVKAAASKNGAVVVAASKASGSPEAAAMLMQEAVPQAKPKATITPKVKEIVNRIVAKLATKSEAELLLIEKMLG